MRGATLVPRWETGRGLISIHAPREGSDVGAAMRGVLDVARFQSTLPVRGATCLIFVFVHKTSYFNPRSP